MFNKTFQIRATRAVREGGGGRQVAADAALSLPWAGIFEPWRPLVATAEAAATANTNSGRAFQRRHAPKEKSRQLSLPFEDFEGLGGRGAPSEALHGPGNAGKQHLRPPAPGEAPSPARVEFPLIDVDDQDTTPLLNARPVTAEDPIGDDDVPF